MFEVGRRYEFRIIEDGIEVVFSGSVDAYEHPLVKLVGVYRPTTPKAGSPPHVVHPLAAREETITVPGRIINILSPKFISALPVV
jgi:hypothetical protein